MSDLATELHVAERHLLAELRLLRRRLREQAKPHKPADELTLGQKVADWVADNMGSWRFIIIQTVILIIWIALNVTAFVQRWDPYPFILLNLALSFQAAYAAPFIMMAQNRQQDIDRKKAESDYSVNIKAELEIELLHQKIDELRAKEMQALTEAVADLSAHVKNEQRVIEAQAGAPRGQMAKAQPAAAKSQPRTTKSQPKAPKPQPAGAPRARRSKPA